MLPLTHLKFFKQWQVIIYGIVLHILNKCGMEPMVQWVHKLFYAQDPTCSCISHKTVLHIIACPIRIIKHCYLPKSLIWHDFHQFLIVWLQTKDSSFSWEKKRLLPLKSTPIVAAISTSNRSSVKRRSKLLFPTPDSPIIKIFNVVNI